MDVVPLYRPYIWASLLNVPSNAAALYGAVDKETPHPVDRQIEVDIPRWVTCTCLLHPALYILNIVHCILHRTLSPAPTPAPTGDYFGLRTDL